MSPASPVTAPAGAEVRAALRRLGAHGPVEDELVAYLGDGFAVDDAAGPPPGDEPFVAAWEGYAARAAEAGVWSTLREHLVQLRFPVRAGISGESEYQAATRRGVLPVPGPGLELRRPGELRLFLHPTPAGRLPVLVAPDRGDFESLVRALTRRNEPDPIPASMGACIVAGYNNWSRVAQLRHAWQAAHPAAGEAGWQAEFRALVPRKELYQDRFVVLCEGGYSATPGAALGMEEDAWLRLSLTIRLEHECAHYFTRRVFGSMRNSLHDELLADWAGITAAAGRYRADWFLRFLGLEDHPGYREGGRLQNYRGTPPLGDQAFAVLREMVVRAATQLERAGPRLDEAATDLDARAGALRAIAGTPLPLLALHGIRPKKVRTAST